MRNTTTLERASQAIGRLAAADAAWPPVCHDLIPQLRRVIGFDSFCIAQNDPLGLIPAAALGDNHAISGNQRLFWQIEMQQPDVNKAFHLAQAPCPVAALSTATGGDLARSTRWHELLRPAGIGDELRAALVAGGRWWGSVDLYRERRARPFTAEDVAALRRLTAPLAAVARRGWTASRNPPPAVGGPGTLVTADGSQVTATPAASRWLSRLEPAVQRSGTLIYALIARLGATVVPYRQADSVRSLIRAADGLWLQLDAGRLMTGAGAGMVAITVQPARPDAVTELLLHAFMLTEREREVAGLVLAGRSTGDIGQELFLSRHTVADHIKAIFSKTSVHTRAQLARRLTGACP